MLKRFSLFMLVNILVTGVVILPAYLIGRPGHYGRGAYFTPISSIIISCSYPWFLKREGAIERFKFLYRTGIPASGAVILMLLLLVTRLPSMANPTPMQMFRGFLSYFGE